MSEGIVVSNTTSDIVYTIIAETVRISLSKNNFFIVSKFGITANKANTMQNIDTNTNTLSLTSASTDFSPLITENVRKDVM